MIEHELIRDDENGGMYVRSRLVITRMHTISVDSLKRDRDGSVIPRARIENSLRIREILFGGLLTEVNTLEENLFEEEIGALASRDEVIRLRQVFQDIRWAIQEAAEAI